MGMHRCKGLLFTNRERGHRRCDDRNLRDHVRVLGEANLRLVDGADHRVPTMENPPMMTATAICVFLVLMMWPMSRRCAAALRAKDPDGCVVAFSGVFAVVYLLAWLGTIAG